VNIPTTFKIAGQPWKVEFDNDLLAKDGEYGHCHEVTNTIVLQNSGPIPHERVEATFIHELLHAIFHELGYDNLNTDEKLVNSLSTLLHQVLSNEKN